MKSKCSKQPSYVCILFNFFYEYMKNERLKRRCHLIFKFQCHLLQSNPIVFIRFTGSSKYYDATGVIYSAPRSDRESRARESSRIVAIRREYGFRPEMGGHHRESVRVSLRVVAMETVYTELLAEVGLLISIRRFAGGGSNVLAFLRV